MAKIDKSKLGIDKHQFDRTSVEFLRATSPMVEAINDRIMEGLDAGFKVIKDDNGHSRPFLVVEYPELHASLAMYMTSSIDDERMSIDNGIRGEHLFKSPFGLVNYISRSAITGGLQSGKISVIDRDRFLFVTNDCFVDRKSQAKEIEELGVGLNLHMMNAQNIAELLELDLAGKNFTSLVRSGKSQLWVYKKTERQPIMFNPSAMYLSLAINAFSKYDNKKLNLDAKSLGQMGEVAGDSVYAYGEYLKYNEKVRELEQNYPEVYKIYETVRYYAGLTPATYEKILDNKETCEESGKRKYYYIYGDPVLDSSVSIDKRITFEINRAEKQGLITLDSNKKMRDKYIKIIKSNSGNKSLSDRLSEATVLNTKNGIKEKIAELLKEEKQVSATLSTAVEDVLSFLDKVNGDERINLSQYNYNQVFWQEFYSSFTDDNYIGSVMDSFSVKYKAMADFYNKKKQDIRRASIEERESKKQAMVHQTRAERAKQAKIKELKDRLENHYMELYSQAVKQHLESKLLPIKDAEKSRYKALVTPVAFSPEEITIGKEIFDRFTKELSAMKEIYPQFNERIKTITSAEKKIEKLTKNPDNLKMFNIVSRICAAEQKYSRTNGQKLNRNARKRIISEVVDSLSEEELGEIIEGNNSYGENDEEILLAMQDINLNRSLLESYARLKENKIKTIEAITELNDKQVLVPYHMTIGAVGELSKNGAVIPNGDKIKTVEEFCQEYAQLETDMGSFLKTAEYKSLIDKIEQDAVDMRKTTVDAQELLKARTNYYSQLKAYEQRREGLAKRVVDTINDEVQEFQDKTIKALTNYESYNIKKIGENKYVEAAENGTIIWKGTKAEVDELVKYTSSAMKLCYDYNNYIDLDKDMNVINKYFNICYPTSADLAEVIKEKLAKATSLKDALKVYKEGETLLLKLVEEEDEFVDLVSNEYREVVNVSEAICESASKWSSLFKDFGYISRDRKKGKKELKEPWLSKVLQAYTEVTDEIVKKVFDDYNSYREALRDCVENLADGYKPRVDKFTDADELLIHSVGKAKKYGGKVEMPKSLLGEHGVVESMLKVAYIKNQAAEVFSTGANFDGKGNDEDEFRGYKIGLIKACMDDVNLYLHKGLSVKLDAIKREELNTYKSDLIETTRLFALKSEENRSLVVDEDGLEVYLKHMIQQDGINAGKIPSCLSYEIKGVGTRKPVKELDFIPYFSTLLENLPNIREALEKGEKFEGKYEKAFEEPLQAFLKMKKLKAANPSAQISLSIKNKIIDDIFYSAP